VFPEQNPAPILRVGEDGALLNANPGANVLLAEWKCQVGQMVPDDLHGAIGEALAPDAPAERDIHAGGRDYSFVIVPVASHRYANLYGRDITHRKRAEEVLRESAYQVPAAEFMSDAATVERSIVPEDRDRLRPRSHCRENG
jgi:hypothetical protein